MPLANIHQTVLLSGVTPVYRGEAVALTQEGFDKLNRYIEALEFEAVKLYNEGAQMASELCNLDKAFDLYRLRTHDTLGGAQVTVLQLEVENMKLRRALSAYEPEP